MNNPISINGASERDAVIDPIYRAVIGLDTNDLPLFESAWINRKDAVFEMDGNVMAGLDQIQNMFNFIGPLATTHFITNVRVNMREDGNTADVTAYALAQHYKAGEGLDPSTKHLLSGSMYQGDVVKDTTDNLWKLRKWNMKIIWTQGDRSIVTPS